MATDMTAEEAAKQLRVEAAASRSRALIDELHREPYWNSLAQEQEAYAALIEQLTNENQRLRERTEELEAELANERGIKEQFKAALARQEELAHQEELESQLAQREEPIAETCSHCHGQSPVNAFGLCGECSRMLSEFVQRQSAAEARTRVAES